MFLALLREPRAEGATRVRPADLGRVLGLDRAPEVTTIRRKLAELAGHGRGAQLQGALARDVSSLKDGAVSSPLGVVVVRFLAVPAAFGHTPLAGVGIKDRPARADRGAQSVEQGQRCLACRHLLWRLGGGQLPRRCAMSRAESCDLWW